MELNEFLDKFIKVTDKKTGKWSIQPAANEGHFRTRNQRQHKEENKSKISRPKLEEVKAWFPGNVAEYFENNPPAPAKSVKAEATETSNNAGVKTENKFVKNGKGKSE